MIVLVTGERNVGKTTVVERTVSVLQNRGLEVVGAYTVETADGLGLVDARTGDSRRFATRSPRNETINVGRYHIELTAIDHARQLANEPGDVLVLDELGKLERRGEGFYPVLEGLDPKRYRGVLLSVRSGLTGFVADHLPPGTDSTTIEVTEGNRDRLPKPIADLLAGEGGH